MRRPFPRSAAVLLVLALLVPLMAGCLRVRASITISPDDLVSGQVTAAATPRGPDDKGPQFDSGDLPFSHKIAVSDYTKDGFVGSSALFSDLTFAELPQLASMNREAAGLDLSLRRAGNLVILDGRADLTSVTDPNAEVSLSVSFPGDVTSTDGSRIDSRIVEWVMKPGVVTTINAQARSTDPSARSFTSAAVWLGLGGFLVAGIIAVLAWQSRDRSPRYANQPES